MDSSEVSELIAFFNARNKLNIKEPGEKQSTEEMVKAMEGIVDHQEKVEKWQHR